jgi:hypothetical protein
MEEFLDKNRRLGCLKVITIKVSLRVSESDYYKGFHKIA